MSIPAHASRTLLEELFSATPLGIFIAAVKAALQQRAKRSGSGERR